MSIGRDDDGPGDGVVTHAIPPAEFAIRAAWVALRLLLVVCLGEQGVLFFYQGF